MALRIPFFVLAALASAAIVGAAEGWRERPAFEASASELQDRFSALPKDKASEISVLWADVGYTFDSQGRATVRRRTIYRIPRAGDLDDYDEWDVAQVGWAPWYQDRPGLRARVLSADGSFRELDQSTLTERAAERWGDDIFSDARVLEAPLPALADGAIVEVESVVKDRDSFFAAGSAYREFLLGAPYVHSGRVTVEAASELPLHWKVEGATPVQETQSVEERFRRLRFEYGPLSQPEEWQSSVPPSELPAPQISFSTSRDWASVARAYSALVETKLDRAIVGQLLGTAAGKTLAREAAIDLVLSGIYRNVRYTGLELGAQAIIPVRPEETIRRGFGDCKDQATLMVAALRQLGVPAHVALLRSGFDRDVTEGVPGMGLFTHAIVFVPGEPAYWIDPTFKFARFSDLPDADLDRWALVAAEGTTGLVRTPQTTVSERRQVQTREVFMAPIGKGRVVEVTEYLGAAEVEARSEYEPRSEKALKEQFEEYAKTEFLNAKLDRFEVSPASELSQPFRLRLEMSETGRVMADSGEAVVAVMVSDLFSVLPWELSRAVVRDKADVRDPKDKRTLPYRLHRPVESVLRYIIRLPAGMVLRDPPSTSEKTFGPITLSRRVETPTADRVEVEVRLAIRPGTLGPQEFEELIDRLPEMNEEPALLVYFDQDVAKFLAAGSVGEGLSLARRLVANEPESAFRRGQMSLALLAAGMGEAACQEAERATGLEPKSSTAFQALGWCYQHDSIGRRFGTEFGRGAAIAAYRKAVELDPKNRVAHADLAILLEHDAQGQRYGRGIDLEEPIGIYRALEKEGDLGGLRNNLVIALLRASRVKEALELLPRETQDATGRQLRVLALVLDRGVTAALAEARRWLGVAAERSSVLRGSAFDLLTFRRFGDGAEVFKASAAEAPNAAEILRFASAVEQAARWQFEAGSPEALAFELSSGFLDPSASEKLRSRIAPDVLEVLGQGQDDLMGSAKEAVGPVRAVARALNLEPAVLIELGLRAASYEREGDEAFGYRVRMQTQFGTSANFSVYLVATPQGLKAALSKRATGALGVLALKALERGDAVSARRWLDWAYDEDEAALTSNVVRRLWSKGEQSESKCRRAALALAVEGGGAGNLRERLAEAAQGSDVSEQSAVDLARARGAMLRGDYESALRSIESLATQGGLSPELRATKLGALEKLKRWNELREFAVSLRSVDETKAEADRIEATAEFGAGRLVQAIGFVEVLEAKGKAISFDFNRAAWATLFVPGYDDKAVRWAQRAAELTSYQSSAVLNTLAAVYAWQGKPREAYQLVVQSLDLESGKGPSAGDWVILGRISEDYGLKDDALRLYRRAIEAESREPLAAEGLSVGRLAKLQLERLEGKPARKRS